MSDRKQEILNEFKLRRLIRKAIRIKEMKRKKSEDQKLYEEKNLRNIIRHLLQEASGPDADGEPSPYGSTPVSALADAFNEILKPIKTGLRKLHEPEERESYRAHILSKFQTIFQTFEGLDVESPTMVGESDVEIDGPGRDVSIDDDNRVMPSDGSEDERFKEKEKDPDTQKQEDFDMFKIAGKNPGGAMKAFDTIENSNIEQTLADARKMMYTPEYKKEFKEYALYNIDLWLTTFEKDLADSVGQEPSWTETVMPRPEGAKVSSLAAGGETTGGGETEETLGLEMPGAGESFEVPELPAEESLEEEDLETVFME